MRGFVAGQWRRAASLMGRFRRDEGGVSLVEFSLIFPILVVLFLGLVEFGEAFSVSRRVSATAATVSDLVSQTPSVTDADLNDIAQVARELIKPYRADEFGMVISSVVANDDNTGASVAWSYATGKSATARTEGSVYALPAGITEASSSVIMVETFYDFSPSVGLYLTGTHSLQGQAYFRPRLTRVVAKN